ncbi:DEAD/DEAH box helicase [Niallia sp. SS-2023]|uniref:DEAD/DEAH box helicase n=1 Tax=Niallia sp. SS-2023 TaxID=3051155 RepID=UPI00254F21B8|nr:DEAD/DEAH box helicase [Niallia sp. SS-2023]MDL0434784.1 DEAD/DEAH box helicase [Niallia sp. SS-2023]
MTDFKSLGINDNAINLLRNRGIIEPSPIQKMVIPSISEGKDVIAQAQTGTGKTYAFALPIVQKLKKDADYIQALIVSPTRELAIQIAAEIEKVKPDYAEVLTAYGGQDVEKQLHRMKDNISIVVATPGRLIDYMKRGHIKLDRLKVLVLDEADQMLHIGFLEEVKYIMRKSAANRQTLMFSATISDNIKMLAKKYMKEAEYITAEKKQGPAVTVKQFSMHSTDRAKQGTLMSLITSFNPYMAVVFCRTKRRVSKLYEVLRNNGFECRELHGDLSQAKREQVMKDFRNVKFPILIATDVAARGLDIDGISHVFNYDIPADAESYVHRIGRTGRAGLEGFAITLYTSDDRQTLDMIEDELGIRIEKMQQLKKTDDKKVQEKKAPDSKRKTGFRAAQKAKAVQGRKKQSSNEDNKKQDSGKRNSNSGTRQEKGRTNGSNASRHTGSAVYKPKRSKKK